MSDCLLQKTTVQAGRKRFLGSMMFELGAKSGRNEVGELENEAIASKQAQRWSTGENTRPFNLVAKG